jgi:osmotically inducible protein OsmC
MTSNGLTRVLYTAEASTDGGRAGHGRTSDGHLAVELSVPEVMGGQGGRGTNPEQLFALAYAACFQSSLMAVAEGHGLDPSDSRITARIGIGPTGHGGFGIQAALDIHLPHIPFDDATALVARADQRCPYSNATRDNIKVTLTIDGKPVTRNLEQALTSGGKRIPSADDNSVPAP